MPSSPESPLTSRSILNCFGGCGGGCGRFNPGGREAVFRWLNDESVDADVVVADERRESSSSLLLLSSRSSICTRVVG